MELLERILSSASYAGLQSEQEAAALFERAGWSATTGLYYLDEVTGKTREIDIFARQFWEKQNKKSRYLTRLTVVGEVKSMKGFHLLVAPHRFDSSHFHQHIHSIADQSGKYLDIAKGMRDLNIPEPSVKTFVHQLDKFAYPGGYSRTFRMAIRPQPMESFTSFRETNIGAEKELDASVLWKAILSLRSAHSSLRKTIRIDSINEALDSIEYELQFKDGLTKALKWVTERLCWIDIVHPVVITDADIWLCHGNTPAKAKFARFAGHTYPGTIE